MKKEIGEIENPEQFLDVSENECVLSSSVAVYELFTDFGYPENICIAPIELAVNTIDKTKHLFWSILDLEEKIIKSIIPVFKKDDFDVLNNIDFSSIKVIENDVFFVFKNSFYCLLTTSTGEIVIKKLNGVWCEDDVKTLISLILPHLKFPSIYPVELFSKSKHHFITTVWAIEDPENNIVNWYPVCFNDIAILQKYDNEDITMFPLNVGDITKASNITFEVLYEKELGINLKKTKKAPLWRHQANDLRNDPQKTKVLKLEVPVSEKKKSSASTNKSKGIIIKLNPKKTL